MRQTIFLIILGIITLLVGCSLSQPAVMQTSGQKSASQSAGNVNVTALETNLKFTVEDVIDAFNIADLHYFRRPGTTYPVLNKMEPRPFDYLDGTLFVYIFNNNEECKIGLNEATKTFSSLAINQPDIEPLIYKANNALIVYVPSFSMKARMLTQMEWLLFLKEAKEERGLTKEMVKGLGNLGFSNQEILDLPQKEIDRIFAPGTHLDGAGFDFSALSEQEQENLIELGIDSDKSVILNNLGYEFIDMTNISKAELDLIFPNTELIANLEKLGLTKNDIAEKLNSGLNYKDIIKEALNH